MAAALLLAGCRTTEEPRAVSWRAQQAYLAGLRDPRLYRIDIYNTPAGVQYRGGGRLHPNQMEVRTMEAEEPWRSVVMMTGRFGDRTPVLLDFTSPFSWMEFDTARTLGAVPIGEREARLVKYPEDEHGACLSVVSKLRFGILHIEEAMMYVRFGNGDLGPLARGIKEPVAKAVIGWDLLKKFEYFQFDYLSGSILLSTTEPYVPHPDHLLAAVPVVKHAGVCAVSSELNGKSTLLLIDPLGDFEVAADSPSAFSLRLDKGFVAEGAMAAPSPGGTRLGARFLEKYRVTICPQAGVIYFERPMREK